jgi:5'-AMP-activated protein kinase catalytic alpha subunit
MSMKLLKKIRYQLSKLRSKHSRSTLAYSISGFVLGEGTQARVYLGQDNKNGRAVAIKVFNPSAHPSFIEAEINALQSNLEHNLKHSLRLFEVVKVGDSTAVITPLAYGRELHHLVTEERLSELVAKKLFYKILVAVSELHSSGYCHLDLKLENIIYDSCEDAITLIDFGFAEKIYGENFDSEVLLQKFCGSVHYTCPEIGRHQPYQGTKADIWALGVVLYTMVNGVFPFNSEPNSEDVCMDVLMKIQLCEINWPPHFSAKLVQMISCMLQPQPEDRWDISELLCHPWFTSP